MYNLIEYSTKISVRLWNYYRDERNSGLGVADNDINYSIKDSESFDDKTSITGKLEGIDTTKDVEIAVPLKHLSNFWKTLDLLFINCEVSLILTWSENCVIISKKTREVAGDNPVAGINNRTGITFTITDTTFFVPLLEQLKTRLKKTIGQKCLNRSKLTTEII